MASTRRTFVFDTETDADLLTALDKLRDGEKSEVVRAALRGYFHLAHPQPTLTDILDRLDSLQDEIARLRQNGMAGPTDPPADDDSPLTAALLDLGL